MFKKLKEKITEGLPASVQQQLSQTLVDIAEDSAETSASPRKQFSIGESDSRPITPVNRDEQQFQAVNLNESKRENATSTPQPSSSSGYQGGGRLSRQSSLSSVFSDISSFLPGGESSFHPYQFQSDLESNVSEFDDSASTASASDRISKEHVYNAYQKMRARYHKYKGRYADLAKHYRELEREREKVKHVLVETQDRSLRRISELREQCALEQQAKAHLEENLRSDLEEKDNLIAVLNTKVKLLKSGTLTTSSEGILVDLSTSADENGGNSKDQTDGDTASTTSSQEVEVQQLREKLVRFESLLMKCKENIKSQKERIAQLQADNEAVKQTETAKSNELSDLQKDHSAQLSQLTDSLNLARQEIETLRRQEQESALAVAEAKQKFHSELLKQEEEINKLRSEREHLNSKIASMGAEITSIKEDTEKQLQEAEMVLELEKQKLLKELSRGKTEALKLMDEDMDHRLEELKQEKDIYWEGVLKKRLGEEEEKHVRSLRQAEEHYSTRLAELQEEKSLALEEKELHCASLIAQEKNNHQGLLDELANIKREMESKEKMLEKAKEELVEERRSWVQQIEENRQRHLEAVELSKEKHQQQVEQLKIAHESSLDTALLELKQQHRKTIEEIQQQHEELLQAANEDMESSAKMQLDQLRTLVREKEAALVQRGEEMDQQREELQAKDNKMSELGVEIKELRQQLESMDQQLKIVEKTQEESLQLTIKIQLLEEETEKLKQTLQEERVSSNLVQQQFEERSAEYEKLHQLVDDLKKMNTELESQHKLQSESSNESIVAKDNLITELQQEIEKIQTQWNSTKSEWESNKTELSDQLKAAQIDMESSKAALLAQEEKFHHLEEALALAKTNEDAAVKDREQQLLDLQSLQQKLDAKEQLVIDLQEQVQSIQQYNSSAEEWSLQVQNLSGQLDATRSEMESIKSLLASKEESLALLGTDAENLRSLKAELDAALEEKELQLNQKQTEFEAFQQSTEVKDRRIAELEEDVSKSIKNSEEQKELLESVSKQLDSFHSDLEQTKAVLSNKEETMAELEKNYSAAIAMKDKLKSLIAEKDGLLEVKQSELEAAQQSLNAGEEQVIELQKIRQEMKEKESAWDQQLKSVLQDLESTRAQLETLQSSQSTKESRILELEEAERSWKNGESELKIGIEERGRELATKIAELASLQESLDQRGKKITDLESQLELSTRQAGSLSVDAEEKLKQLEAVRAEVESLSATITSRDVQIEELRQAIQEKERSGSSKDEELIELRESLDRKEERITDLLKDIERIMEDNSRHSSELERLRHASVDLENAQSENVRRLETQNVELEELRQLIATKEHRIAALQGDIGEMAQHLAYKDGELDGLNQSLSVKESEILKLQEEVRQVNEHFSELRNEASSTQTERAGIERLLVLKASELEELKEKLTHDESNWTKKVEDLSRQLEQMEAKWRDDLASKEAALEEMEARHNLESEMIRQSHSESASARIAELEKGVSDSLSRQLKEHALERDILTAECAKLQEELESVKNQSAELVQNQLKSLNDEVTKLTDDKSRLELLCKRLKVQLADTRKMVKTAADAETEKNHQQESGPNEDLLQQQLVLVQRELDTTRQQYKTEVAELRRLLELGRAPSGSISTSSNGANNHNFHSSLEEATELEYLRNILYEFMMGRQTATLAKVVGAVVKFTPEQTRKIAEREEQRQSLLGQLGFA